MIAPHRATIPGDSECLVANALPSNNGASGTSKPYCQEYERLLPELLASERRIEFLDVIKRYPVRREV
ncbi:hypothetical protein [Pseudomonas sp. C1C7]|uniref:hypothetical protein n=1 Tax=Pseudomonas sp. C1C7 TaxID=2735272 RepID=UPI0021144F12|nr:hypothetical protein [Pseudomonas sp. C1C7]